MKKSEAENLIKSLIEMNLETLRDIPDASLVAHLILYTLEKTGMKPLPTNIDEGFMRAAGINFEWDKE